MDMINVKTDFGAYGDGTHDDTVAIQNAITQSQLMADQRAIYFPQGTYVITSTLYKNAGPRGLNMVAVPNSVTLDYHTITTGVPCLKIIGGSGPLCQAKIEGFIFEGSANTIAIEIAGQDGQLIERCTFRTNNIGIRFHNEAVDTFTEWCTASYCSFEASCNFALHYKRTSGNSSFHGSGLTVVNYINTKTNSGTVIQIDNNCLPYNCPLNAQVWFGDSTQPAITFIANYNSNASEVPYFNGNITFEHFGGTLTLASGNRVYFTGGIQVLGDYVSSGQLYQCKAVVANKNNSTTPYGLRWNMQSLISSGSIVVNTGFTGSIYMVFITLIGDNYDYRCWGVLDTTGGPSLGGYFVDPPSTGISYPVFTRKYELFHSWGPPTFGFTSTGQLIVTNPNYPSGAVTIYATFNQIADQYYGNYPAASF